MSDPRLPALSLWPPRGSAIIDGHKWIEARHRPTRHRGLLAIHSTVRVCEDDDPVWLATPAGMPHVHERGAVIGVACLIDCVPMLDSRKTSARCPGLDVHTHILRRVGRPATDVTSQIPLTWMDAGLFAYVLDGVQILAEPVSCGGGQGMWRLPEEATTAVLGQLS